MNTPKEFFTPQMKGRIKSYLARESEPLPKLVKYLRTMGEKYGYSKEELQLIVLQAKKESVDPFLNPGSGFYQPQRLDRYHKLCEFLGLRVNF
jgi:hypothetical protein